MAHARPKQAAKSQRDPISWSVSFARSSGPKPITRRRFLTATALGASGLALYSGEIARHRIQITQPEIRIPSLPAAFDGFRITQLSDIHLDEFTEPFFLREAVSRINGLQPDAVFLTGDFITNDLLPRKFPIYSMWKCARILETLACKQRYAVLGNHDVVVSPSAVTAALTASNISVLRNGWVPLERGTSRLWLSGVDDPLEGGKYPLTSRNNHGIIVVYLEGGYLPWRANAA